VPRPPREQLAARRRAVGQRIRSLRQAHALSQAKLAKLLGVEQPHVSNIERGARSATLQQVTRLSKKLGVSTDTILGAGTVPQVQTLRGGKLYRYLQRIEELPAADQKAVLQILDSLLRRAEGNGAGRRT
jgi:transcriptional regulator with XRE-family HTH domain